MPRPENDFVPVVIVGAPRSGTNMLRDVLCSFDGLATWPCDEINPVWRYGNVGYPDDQIPPSRLNPSIARYIKKQFGSVARKYSASWVVEKTCANSLRVDFVDAVLPDAKYIYIVRDGFDAVGSARIRWKARFDLSYTLKKLQVVPLIDIPVYFMRFLRVRMHRLLGKEKRLEFWGPIFPGLDSALKEHDLETVCALQWKACVDRSDECLARIDPSRVYRLRYEEFVANPEYELRRLLDFLGVEVSPLLIREAVAEVSSGSLGKGRRQLGEQESQHLQTLLGDTLSRHGY